MTKKHNNINKHKPLKEITISMEKIHLICDYYGIPLVVFFNGVSEDDLRRWIRKYKTAKNVELKYRYAIEQIRDIIIELDNRNKEAKE